MRVTRWALETPSDMPKDWRTGRRWEDVKTHRQFVRDEYTKRSAVLCVYALIGTVIYIILFER